MTLLVNRDEKTEDVGENPAAQAIIAKALDLAGKGYMVGWIAESLVTDFNMDDLEAYAVAEDAGMRVALGRK
jgi:hypothetical protein